VCPVGPAAGNNFWSLQSSLELFEGPISNKTNNESVTSCTSERRNYSNAEGRRLLAHIHNSSNENNDAASAIATGRSQKGFLGGKTDVESTDNLVETSREQSQKQNQVDDSTSQILNIL